MPLRQCDECDAGTTLPGLCGYCLTVRDQRRVTPRLYRFFAFRMTRPSSCAFDTFVGSA